MIQEFGNNETVEKGAIKSELGKLQRDALNKLKSLIKKRKLEDKLELDLNMSITPKQGRMMTFPLKNESFELSVKLMKLVFQVYE